MAGRLTGLLLIAAIAGFGCSDGPPQVDRAAAIDARDDLADKVRDGLVDLGLTMTGDRSELATPLQGDCPDGTAHFGILEQFARSDDDIERTVTDIAGQLLLELGGETTSRREGDVVRATFDDDVRVEVDAPLGESSLSVLTESGCLPES